MIEAAKPIEARDLLLKGQELCTEQSPLFKALNYSVGFTVNLEDVEKRNEYLQKLQDLEPLFDIPECHEVFAQVSS